ncbi:hypothetical protein MLD38_001093 [Melastoma candidum]|uniref:Uncharacterized protein n=1 Tax=Melastoma candidum TaxID=119954 RepID=A0ACB9SE37_9MYRT|nr:hypothetical protein MLD38_001093 [Melastoma candidum]
MRSQLLTQSLLSVTLIFVVSSSIVVSMAGESSASVHIVYTERPEGDDHESVHLRTLSSVLGSEEKAKESLVYVYKHAASGFSAKLTPEQVSELSKQPGVLQVLPDQKYQLHTRAGMLH